MKLTDLQKAIAKAIYEKTVTNITSFFKHFCKFQIKQTIGILDNVDVCYLSLDIEKNRTACQQFVILTNKLKSSGLIELSPDESDYSLLIFESEDGPRPAQLDARLLKIVSDHLSPYHEGYQVSKEIITLPELEEFIKNDFLTEDEIQNQKKINRAQKSFVISIFAIILTLFSYIYLYYRHEKEDERFEVLQYETNGIRYRPKLEIVGKPIIERVILKRDSVNRSGDFINAYNKLGFTAELNFKNTGNTDAKILAVIQTDTVSGAAFIRDMLLSETMRARKLNKVYLMNEFFLFKEVSRDDTTSFKVNHELNFITNSEAVLHFLVLYENELGNLYDTYYWAKFKIKTEIVGRIEHTILDTTQMIVKTDLLFAKKDLRNLIVFKEDNQSSYPYDKDDRDSYIKFHRKKMEERVWESHDVKIQK